MKRATLATLAAATTLALPAAADTVDIGVLLPFSGVYAALGNEIEAGFALGLETYGNDLDVEIILHREDTEVTPATGLARTRKLILQSDVDAIVGVVSSGVLGAVRDMVDGAGVPLIVANAGNDAATGVDCSPWITRVSFSNSQVNRPMGRWMAEQGIETVYTLAPDYAAGRQMIEGFTGAFVEAGGTIVGSDYTPFQQTQDFGPYIAQAQASGADALFVFYAGGEAISFVNQYASFGAGDDLPLYGSGFLTSQLYVDAQGQSAEGVITALHYVPTIDNAENAAFVAAFRDATGRVPSEYAVQGYDAARALIEALETGARDRETLGAALRQVSFDGPRGALSIDPATNNVVQPIYVYETVQGANGMTQTVLAQLPAEADPVNGCQMPSLPTN
ncbi:ABC transporter substrate-binding protein [Roseicyclus marinus]|uniref:ABC transporter substrate-binding protein n=1 Tax=Roseicyclus marinus TaxID=2161673 RepID=A0AA48KJN3_9RHOB|nr:ABC transporter substrate-binding protein [Roseicyclus marinus]